MAIQSDFSFTEPSIIEHTKSGRRLILSHKSEVEEINKIPVFFWGKLKNSYLTSRCLLTLAKVVRSRFVLTHAELTAMKDPIVTSGANCIRFEGFSSCNGVYTRLDILPEGLDGEFIESGTTNVDFNEPMLNALNLVQKNEELILGIGQDHVTVITEKKKTIEKKVTLPNRWIKGLTSIQHYLADMTEVFHLNKLEVIQLFQSLPKSTIKGNMYIVQRAGKYIFTILNNGKTITVGSPHRLRLMESLIPHLTSLKIYKSEDSQACCFIALIENLQMVFAFSADAYRGFSGEGKFLDLLIENFPIEIINNVNNLFKANELFNSTLFSIENEIDFCSFNSLAANLSSMGLLGFDVLNNSYFYRRLPFKLERILNLNPRLKNAKKLVDENEIKIIENYKNNIVALVKGTEVTHKVQISSDTSRCTCEWYNKYKNNRGLCRHVLSVKIMLEG